MRLNRPLAFIFVLFQIIACQGAQSNVKDNSAHRLVGGPCEGCEAVLESGTRQLSAVDTLPGFDEAGQKLKISGTIYQNDGVTPAAGVVLYLYQTNTKGVYPTRGNEKGWARRHGFIRTWLKTDANGRYTFYTVKPASYPNSTIPAHIHPIVLEPNGKYYWVGSYLFEDDPYLTEQDKNEAAPRAGSPKVITLQKHGDLLTGKRDFILGKNIPGYK